MFTFHRSVKLKVQEQYDPYIQYAKAGEITEDKGWAAVFIGSEGNDLIYGDEFSDTMYGNGGRDGLVGGGGNDKLYGGDDNDTFIGGEGADEMFGEEGDDFFWGELDGNIIDGGSGIDTICYSGFEVGVTVVLSFGFAQRNDSSYPSENLTNVENVIGTNHDDIIGGDSLAAGNRLSGGGGNDYISGEGGTDVIIGGYGADVLLGGSESDTFLFNLGDSNGEQYTFDTIKDFDRDDDVMRFQVYDPATADWSVREGMVDGAAGTWVQITQLLTSGAQAETKTLYEVFLEGTVLSTVDAGDIELF